MKRFRDISIKTKLNILLSLSAGVALGLASIAFVVNDINTIRSSTVSQLSAVTDVVGANTVAAVTFHDRQVAAEVLSSLKHEPTVRFACVYDKEGKPFATYTRSDYTPPSDPPPMDNDGHGFAPDGSLQVFQPISDSQDRVGTLYVEAGMEHLHTQMIHYGWMAFAVLITSLGLAILMSSRLAKVVSVPISRLAETAKQISGDHDYSVRVEKQADDEIGCLYEEFNHMLGQIEIGQEALRQARDELEVRVQERTRQLTEAVDELRHENAERRRAEENLKSLQKEHITAAHRMGMAEVATSVLHNVGNVLNSVNVSISLIGDRLKQSGAADFCRVVEIVRQHRDDFRQFVTEDERGRHLPNFLIELGEQIAAEEETLQQEIAHLTNNLDHIKDIISVQQSHARISGLVEEVDMAALIEDAIRINLASAERHFIQIERDFEELPPISVEKQKVLQILVNVISNAKYALISKVGEHKTIRVRLARGDSDCIRIELTDNGVGISPENLTRIFSHGFTTRREGHGFGLHSAALAAEDMDGTLTARSDGVGCGATFVLEIPYGNAEEVPCLATHQNA